MAILIDRNNKVIIQGITGRLGRRGAIEMLKYGTNVVCGVTPGKGGEKVEGVPVYNSIAEAKKKHDIDTSVVLVPPNAVKPAVVEAVNNGIKIVNIITEGVPIQDTAHIIALAKKYGCIIIGPSSVGVLSPEKAKLGCVGNNKSFMPGRVGILSKSGGMASETALVLKQEGMGQSTVIGIGGDILIGTAFVELVRMFEEDEETDAIVIYGEIGGTYEEELAEYLAKKGCIKPIVAFISGKFASSLPYVPLGHAGAFIEGKKGTRESKISALKKAGVHVAEVHHEIPEILKKVLNCVH